MPVLEVQFRQLLVAADHQYVLRVPFLRRLGEVEAAGNHGFLVEDHDLAVGDGEIIVDPHRNPGVRQKCRRGIFLGFLALVQHDPDVHAAFVRVQQSLGDIRVRETVGLHLDGLFRFADRPDDQAGPAAVRAERHLDGPGRLNLVRLPDRRRQRSLRGLGL